MNISKINDFTPRCSFGLILDEQLTREVEQKRISLAQKPEQLDIFEKNLKYIKEILPDKGLKILRDPPMLLNRFYRVFDPKSGRLFGDFAAFRDDETFSALVNSLETIYKNILRRQQ